MLHVLGRSKASSDRGSSLEVTKTPQAWPEAVYKRGGIPPFERAFSTTGKTPQPQGQQEQSSRYVGSLAAQVSSQRPTPFTNRSEPQPNAKDLATTTATLPAKMRFSSVAVLLAAALASAVSTDDVVAPSLLGVEARGADEPVLEREVMDLAGKMVKRACDYSVNCKCDSRGKQLTVCGNCRWNSGSGPYVVTRNRKLNHIYECSKDGTKCCSYGPANDCGTSGARCIIN
ncbi:hypothetical protein RB597_010154 [Gaeumannomyces tritici]